MYADLKQIVFMISGEIQEALEQAKVSENVKDIFVDAFVSICSRFSLDNEARNLLRKKEKQVNE